MHSCCASASVSGQRSAGNCRKSCLIRLARLSGSRYLTRILAGACARKRLSSSGLRLIGKSRHSAEKIIRVRGRSKRRFSENIT
ncbi:hypothetical protein D3C85_1566170 [compost metagenome]